MRILIIMDPGILIPPKAYGGHERLVYMFAREYHKMGHDVHLLVTKGSFVEDCTIHGFGKEGIPQNKWEVRKTILVAWKFLWKHRNKFDLIHNFGRLIYLLPILNHRVKKIMTYGREIRTRNIQYITKLPNKNLVFTGCSSDLVSRGRVAGKWYTVYNAIEFRKYDPQKNVSATAPLIFLGRIEKIKGCHIAIDVAKATGNTLIIAGNVSNLPEEQEYFKKEIEPQIDGLQIKYIGQVNDIQKNKWLGKCKALLFPIEWNEPFGMVMIEAMACGTPVIGFNRGSVNEVVDEGATGFKVNNINEMITATKKIDIISRSGCRLQSEKRFDANLIAKQYLQLFN